MLHFWLDMHQNSNWSTCGMRINKITDNQFVDKPNCWHANSRTCHLYQCSIVKLRQQFSNKFCPRLISTIENVAQLNLLAQMTRICFRTFVLWVTMVPLCALGVNSTKRLENLPHEKFLTKRKSWNNFWTVKNKQEQYQLMTFIKEVISDLWCAVAVKCISASLD